MGRPELRWHFSSMPKDDSDHEQEVGFSHVQSWKSVNIRAIIEFTRKIST